jgi:hypothetical protein
MKRFLNRWLAMCAILFVMAICLFPGCDDNHGSNDDFIHAQVIYTAGGTYDYMVIASKDTFLHCSACYNPVWFQWPSMKPAECVPELNAVFARAQAKKDIETRKDTSGNPLFKP